VTHTTAGPLFDPPREPPTPPPPRPPADATGGGGGEEPPDEGRAHFERFHAADPIVYELFCRFTLEAIRRGRERFGARLVWERIRWHTRIEIDSEDDYQMNDHYVPWYARLFMEDHPEHEGIFETRHAKADECPRD